jgi:NADH-quinone oxidoreductase subunit L
MSGLRGRLPQTAQLMLVGCLALAGVFPLAGFFSKDTIITALLERGYTFVDGEQALTQRMWMPLTAIALVTAFMTAFYTFRLWFRVFAGPEAYEMGSEHHAAEHDAATHDAAHAAGPDQHHPAAQPHEMPWSMNAPLAVLAVGSLLAGLLLGGPIRRAIERSTAQPAHTTVQQALGGPRLAPEQIRITSTAPESQASEGKAHPSPEVHVRILGLSLTAHTFVSLTSTALAVLAIAMAHHYHVRDREATAALARKHAGLIRLLEGKYHVDELYHAAIVRPLRLLGEILFVLDGLVIDGLVHLAGLAPGLLSITAWLAGGSKDPNRWLAQRPEASQRRGELQGYGLLTLAGVAVLTLVLLKR